MKIVIDIPEYVYEHIQESTEDSRDESIVIDAVKKGTPLPKGHGRLIDADDLEHITVCSKTRNSGITRIEAPTIIEADCENCDNADKCYPELGYCNTKMERDTKEVTLTADELAQIFAKECQVDPEQYKDAFTDIYQEEAKG